MIYVIASLSVLFYGPARAEQSGTTAVATDGANGAAGPGRPKTVAWDERWPRFRPWQYIATAASYGVLAYVQFGTYRSARPKWVGGILFDDGVQDVVRLSTRGAREAAGTAGDVFWGVTQAVPVLDSLLIGLIINRDIDLTWQMLAIDAQVYGLVAMFSRIMHKTARRGRPLYEHCQTDPSYDVSCGAPAAVASFWSGHTAMPAAAAGLTCANHQYLPLYGGGWPDGLACGVTIATALTTGLTRMMADRHYLSDVIVGFAFGFAVGYGLPVLLHYRAGPKRRETASTLQGGSTPMALVAPMASSETAGLSLIGAF